MLRADPLHPALAAALLGASVVMAVTDRLPDGLRAALVVGYLVLAPGYALLPFFGWEHWLLHALLALSLSISLAVLVATSMSVAGWWQVAPAVAATELLVVSTVICRTWRNKAEVIRLVVGAR